MAIEVIEIQVPGLAGPIGVDWQGDWTLGEVYEPRDAVYDSGGSWRCLVEHTASVLNRPVSGADADTYWFPVVSVGPIEAEIADAQIAIAADRVAVSIDRGITDGNVAITNTNVGLTHADVLLTNANALNVQSITLAKEPYDNLYSTTLPKGVTGLTTIVPGSGGTNGTGFALGLSGGSIVGMAGTFDVVGGAVVPSSIAITNKGLGSGTTPPTVSFAASAGLIGASAIAVVGNIFNSQQTYWVLSADAKYFQLYKNDGTATPAIVPNNAMSTKAAFDTVFDIATEWIAFGGLLSMGLADTAGKLLAGWRQDDGTFRSRLALNTIGGAVSYTYDATTGYTAIDVVGVEASTAEMIVEGYRAHLALVDTNYKVLGYGRDDGSYYFPNLKAGKLEAPGLGGSAVDATNYYFSVEEIANVQQIFRYSKASGIRSQATTLGSNYSPRISADGTKLIFSSNRVLPVSDYFQAVAGGVDYPIKSDAGLVAQGNSLSTASYYPAAADRTISIQGVGGQNDDHVAARMDATLLTCVVAGNQVPASGNVAVSGFLPNIWFHWNSTLGAFRANIIGSAGEVIPGTLTYSTGTLGFVRDTAGIAINVPNPAVVQITSGRIEGSIDASAAPSLYTLLNSTNILYPNYNSISQLLAAGYTVSDIFAHEVADFARIQPLLKKYLILGDYMGQGRLTAAMAPGFGTAANDTNAKLTLDTTITLNAMRAAQWPENFVDLHAALVTGGHSSNFTVLGTVYSIIDNTTLVDGIHPTTIGRVSVWNVVKGALDARGF